MCKHVAQPPNWSYAQKARVAMAAIRAAPVATLEAPSPSSVSVVVSVSVSVSVVGLLTGRSATKHPAPRKVAPPALMPAKLASMTSWLPAYVTQRLPVTPAGATYPSQVHVHVDKSQTAFLASFSLKILHPVLSSALT